MVPDIIASTIWNNDCLDNSRVAYLVSKAMTGLLPTHGRLGRVLSAVKAFCWPQRFNAEQASEHSHTENCTFCSINTSSRMLVWLLGNTSVCKVAVWCGPYLVNNPSLSLCMFAVSLSDVMSALCVLNIMFGFVAWKSQLAEASLKWSQWSCATWTAGGL